MASNRSNIKRKTGRGQEQIRKDLAKLRRKGLTRAKIKRGKRAGGSALKTIKKFRNVLQGKAVVLKTTSKTRKQLPKGQFLRGRGGRIVVPVNAGETVRVNKKTGELLRSSRKFGTRLKARVVSIETSISTLPAGPNVVYGLRTFGGNTFYFAGGTKQEDLSAFLRQYTGKEFLREIDIIESGFPRGDVDEDERASDFGEDEDDYF